MVGEGAPHEAGHNVSMSVFIMDLYSILATSYRFHVRNYRGLLYPYRFKEASGTVIAVTSIDSGIDVTTNMPQFAPVSHLEASSAWTSFMQLAALLSMDGKTGCEGGEQRRKFVYSGSRDPFKSRDYLACAHTSSLLYRRPPPKFLSWGDSATAIELGNAGLCLTSIVALCHPLSE